MFEQTELATQNYGTNLPTGTCFVFASKFTMGCERNPELYGGPFLRCSSFEKIFFETKACACKILGTSGKVRRPLWRGRNRAMHLKCTKKTLFVAFKLHTSSKITKNCTADLSWGVLVFIKSFSKQKLVPVKFLAPQERSVGHFGQAETWPCKQHAGKKALVCGFQIAHFWKNNTKLHGGPFLRCSCFREIFFDTKAGVCKTLGISGKARWPLWPGRNRAMQPKCTKKKPSLWLSNYTLPAK